MAWRDLLSPLPSLLHASHARTVQAKFHGQRFPKRFPNFIYEISYMKGREQSPPPPSHKRLTGGKEKRRRSLQIESRAERTPWHQRVSDLSSTSRSLAERGRRPRRHAGRDTKKLGANRFEERGGGERAGGRRAPGPGARRLAARPGEGRIPPPPSLSRTLRDSRRISRRTSRPHERVRRHRIVFFGTHRLTETHSFFVSQEKTRPPRPPRPPGVASTSPSLRRPA